MTTLMTSDIVHVFAALFILHALYVHFRLWRIAKHVPHAKYDFKRRLARDAVAYAEEQAGSHTKKVGAAAGQAVGLKWSWQDKRDVAIQFAQRQAKIHGLKVSPQELILQIEAELGTLRHGIRGAIEDGLKKHDAVNKEGKNK